MTSLLRLIRNDILWLNSRFAAIGAILGSGLILGAWYAGKEWWLAPVTFGPWWARRVSTRLQEVVAILIIIFICYIAAAVDRARRSR